MYWAYFTTSFRIFSIKLLVSEGVVRNLGCEEDFNMNMGLVNSHIAHWMQQLAGNSIRNVSLGTPRTMDMCLNVILFNVMF